jgi:hypothetical protein
VFIKGFSSVYLKLFEGYHRGIEKIETERATGRGSQTPDATPNASENKNALRLQRSGLLRLSVRAIRLKIHSQNATDIIKLPNPIPTFSLLPNVHNA